MIQFAHVEKFIQDAGSTHVRICNMRGEKIIDVFGASPEDLIAKLKQYEASLVGYGTVIFKAGTENDHKNAFSNASKWTVTFPTAAAGSLLPNQQNIVPMHNQVMSNELMNARVENERLKVTHEFHEKLAALEKKMEKNKDDGFMKYLPALALIIDIPQAKIERMLQLGQVQSYMAGNGAVATPNKETTPATAQTGNVSTNDWSEENVKKIELGLQNISESGKMSAEEIIFLQEHINKDPEGTKQLISMLKMKQAASQA